MTERLENHIEVVDWYRENYCTFEQIHSERRRIHRWETYFYIIEWDLNRYGSRIKSPLIKKKMKKVVFL